jgi:TolB-like protein
MGYTLEQESHTRSLNMKKVHLLLALLLLVVHPSYSISFRIALSDFAVHSKNPNYEFMGKGLSEMIAVELAKATGVDLIEREKRAEVLEEIEFALSDLADATKQVELGKMLAAKYLVFGEIIDMDKEVLISLRMVDVESTKVVWNKQVHVSITNYDYITGYFTMSILEYLGLSVPSSTIAKVEALKEKTEDVVLAFSKAIDAYDRRENAEATKELARARRLDPDNEAVQVYLRKLLVNHSKFKIEAAAAQFPSQNPAYLGNLQYAQVSVLANFTNLRGTSTFLDSLGLDYWGSFGHWIIGYSFPIGPNLGSKTSIFAWAPVAEQLSIPGSGADNNYINVESYGIQSSVGWVVTDWLSVGIGMSIFGATESFDTPWLSIDERLSSIKNLQFAFCAGILLKNSDATITFDILSGFSFGHQFLFHAEEFKEYVLNAGPEYNFRESVALPFLVEETLTFALLDRRLFLLLRQRNDIFIDQPSYAIRVTPGAEIWLTNWFSLRGGVDFSTHKMQDVIANGIGVVGGVTFRIIQSGWDFDLGISYIMEPIRSLPGETIYQPAYYINIAKNLRSKER